ncbi:hypothetical protein M231_02616 [Tremella mesenterica]|uniref:Uncharacterized protein n=1 Tax=Tremella mesenterica TaxID=5217 RepID=A0A4Q1BQE3_TREME|nr:uncharacterized protein TREMEDRAFT_61243 [Tremella mesenterica DSM 1558]EIW70731.1 hypothetical protein TREMEDRAFT_61243 [Tremella mesenterica DSM 1558]RXK40158.1 hypothetical protein M231_02616 [Tremella mesenterica]
MSEPAPPTFPVVDEQVNPVDVDQPCKCHAIQPVESNVPFLSDPHIERLLLGDIPLFSVKPPAPLNVQEIKEEIQESPSVPIADILEEGGGESRTKSVDLGEDRGVFELAWRRVTGWLSQWRGAEPYWSPEEAEVVDEKGEGSLPEVEALPQEGINVGEKELDEGLKVAVEPETQPAIGEETFVVKAEEGEEVVPVDHEPSKGDV